MTRVVGSVVDFFDLGKPGAVEEHEAENGRGQRGDNPVRGQSLWPTRLNFTRDIGNRFHLASILEFLKRDIELE
jgi:hypothetical protein